MEKRKVLFCVPPAVGGAERVTITIAKLLDRMKYDIIIAIIGKEKGNIIDFVPDYMSIRHIKVRNIWDFVTPKMIQFLRNIKPDIVFCSAIYLNSRLIVASKLLGNIKIIIRNNIGLYAVKRRSNVFLAKHTYRYADTIILQTNEMMDEIQREISNLNKEKLCVISNPIDTNYVDEMIRQSSDPFDHNYHNPQIRNRPHKMTQRSKR